MTCYRSQDNWHSYVKNSMNAAELDEMTSHLAHCSECQNTVSLIQETAGFLAKSRADLIPPSTIKINVMMAIDKDRYKENLAGAEPHEGDRLVALIPRTLSSRYKENLAGAESRDGDRLVALIPRTPSSRYKENLAGAESRDGDRLVALMPRTLSSRYKENLADSEPQARTCANSSHYFELKNWGLSMVAAGLLLFTLNLTSLTPNFGISHVAELNSDLGRQIALPFDKMSQVAHDALGKIESLTLSQPK
ncbi:MAG TPA: hypothetical protein VN456_01080 [Desulfosporosinus sp.]|nr:hypothetical protein [Desulfosporosinus sp.]